MRRLEKILSNIGLKLFKGFVAEKDINPDQIDHRQIKNILIVVRHQMGDMLCAVPMMRSIRDFYKDARITLVTKKSTAFEEIFNNNNSPVDAVINYEHGFEKFFNIAKELKDKKIDLAVVPSSVNFSTVNHLLAHFCEASCRVGVKSRDYETNPTAYLMNIKNDFLWGSKKIHQIERNLDVIRQLNIKSSEKPITLSLTDEHQKFADDYFNSHFPDKSRLVVGFHPGAGKEGNIWPPEKFAELAYMLNRKFSPYFFISEGPMDLKYAEAAEKLMREKYGILNITRHKGSLMNNTAIISGLSLFITNDTGVMHLASGFSVPVIALFGPTKAYEWGPVGENKISIQAAGGNVNNIEVSKIFETSLPYLGVKNVNN